MEKSINMEQDLIGICTSQFLIQLSISNFTAIKIYNQLPVYMKSLLSNQKRFKYTLKRFLCQHSFYSIEEYYDYKDDT